MLTPSQERGPAPPALETWEEPEATRKTDKYLTIRLRRPQNSRGWTQRREGWERDNQLPTPSLGQTPRGLGVSTQFWQPRAWKELQSLVSPKETQAKARSPILGRKESSRKGPSLKKLTTQSGVF